MLILAVIPARGGSQRLPRKNLRRIGPWSLVEWAVECARRVPRLDRYILYTDDAEIRKEGKVLSVEVLPESAAMARADVPMSRVIRMAMMQAGPPHPDLVIVLQPTTPFRPPWLIDKMLTHFDYSECDSAVTVWENHPTGEVYGARRDLLLAGRLLGPKCVDVGAVDPAINIDTEWDLVRAERHYAIERDEDWWR